MELTSRRFAVFLASGLSLAVIVGLLVFKVSDSGMNLSSQQKEVAGQPLAAADAGESSTRKTAISSEMSSTAETLESTRAEQSAEAANGAVPAAGNGSTSNGGSGSGAAYDPLAPRNANLGGARGGAQQMSYYRPTNAAPAPQNARTSAPAQTLQPDTGGSTPTEKGVTPRTTAKPNTTTAVPQEPQEPQTASEDYENGAPPPIQEPKKPVAEAESAGEQIASEIAEKALNAGNAVIGDGGEKNDGEKKRPEDPFSASTRVPHAPAEDKGTER